MMMCTVMVCSKCNGRPSFYRERSTVILKDMALVVSRVVVVEVVESATESTPYATWVVGGDGLGSSVAKSVEALTDILW